MERISLWVFSGLAAYLLGSLPFGFLIARSCGHDIRTLGSGNIGATNVFRSISKPLGVLTFALDMLKGVCAAILIPLAGVRLLGIASMPVVLPFYSGALSVAGHNWSCFLEFRGGKGVATGAGVMVALAPAGATLALVLWLLVFLIGRYVSLASITAALGLALLVWPLYAQSRGVWFATLITLLCLLTIWQHRANILRLRAGTELRAGSIKPRDTQPHAPALTKSKSRK